MVKMEYEWYTNLVGGLEPWNFMTVHSVGNHHPNWRTPSFFRGVGSTTNQNGIDPHFFVVPAKIHVAKLDPGEVDAFYNQFNYREIQQIDNWYLSRNQFIKPNQYGEWLVKGFLLAILARFGITTYSNIQLPGLVNIRKAMERSTIFNG